MTVAARAGQRDAGADRREEERAALAGVGVLDLDDRADPICERSAGAGRAGTATSGCRRRRAPAARAAAGRGRGWRAGGRHARPRASRRAVAPSRASAAAASRDASAARAERGELSRTSCRRAPLVHGDKRRSMPAAEQIPVRSSPR